MFCEQSEPALYAAPTCTTGEGPVYVYRLYSSFTTREIPPWDYFAFRLSLRACVQWELKNFLKTKPFLSKTLVKNSSPTGNGLL